MTGKELKTLLLFYGIENKNHGKNVAEMRAKYQALKDKNAEPKSFKKWTDADEAELTKMESDDIPSIDETELGRQRELLKKKKRDDVAKFAVENPEEVAEIIKASKANSDLMLKVASASESETECDSSISSHSTVLVPPGEE